MSAKQTISILTLSVLMILPAGIATAGNIKVQNGNSRVTINRNGDIIIRNTGRRKFYRQPIRRGSAIRIPSRNIYRRTIKKGNCVTYRSNRKSGSGNNRSYTRTITTTCR
jgi:hypothetical protein